jgi:hypothetical protein
LPRGEADRIKEELAVAVTRLAGVIADSVGHRAEERIAGRMIKPAAA